MSEATTSSTVEGMSADDIRETIRAIVIELAPDPDQADDTSKLLVDDLGFHSLALLEMAFTLEDEFDLPPIDETTARKLTTIDGISAHVVEILRERGALVE